MWLEAAETWEKLREINLDEAVWCLGWIYASGPREMPLIEQLEKAEATASIKAPYTAGLAYLYALKGMKPQTESCLRKLIQSPADIDEYYTALTYTALGDKDKAFQWLEVARENRSSGIVLLKVDPRLDSLRSDPRFNNLVKSVHLKP